MADWTLYADGSFHKSMHLGGMAYRLVGKRERYDGMWQGHCTTSTEAEVRAIAGGLARVPDGDRVHIVNDCKSLMDMGAQPSKLFLAHVPEFELILDNVKRLRETTFEWRSERDDRTIAEMELQSRRAAAARRFDYLA